MLKDDEKLLEERLRNRDPREDGLKNNKSWKKKYKMELLDYNYIHTLEEFSLLSPGGLIRPISMRNEELLNGGILIKVTKDITNKWFALLGYFENKNKAKGKFWRVYFDKNYFFFKNPDKLNIDDLKTERGTFLLEHFVSKEEIGNFTESMKPNKVVDNLFNEYNKNKKKNKN